MVNDATGTLPVCSAQYSGAELVDEALRLRRGLGVVPQLRRTEHCALLVEDDHPVLLARHADGADIVRMTVEE